MQKLNSLQDLPRECPYYCAPRSWHLRLDRSLKNIQDDSLWKSLAVSKWGLAVETLAAPRVLDGGWQAYCSHRMNLTAAPQSPLDLGQEQFPDPWSHLVCCILCSRTTGGPLIRLTIKNFISSWPSPTAVLAATEEVLVEAINPLGLQLNRIKALKSMSRDFLAKDWQLPSEFSGCGKFTSDSWRIFCRGHRALEDVEDKNLRRYLQWVLNRNNTSNASNGKPEREERRKKTGYNGSNNGESGKKSKSKSASISKTKTRGVAAQKKSNNGAGSITVRRNTVRGINNNNSQVTHRQTRSSKE